MPTTSGREFVLLMSSPGGYTFSKVLPEEKSSKGVRENRIAQPTITILFLITHIDLSQLLISIYAQGDAERGGMVWQFFFPVEIKLFSVISLGADVGASRYGRVSMLRWHC